MSAIVLSMTTHSYDGKSHRVGIVVASWISCKDLKARDGSMYPPHDTKCSVWAVGSLSPIYVRESFDDIAALLSAKEGEPR